MVPLFRCSWQPAGRNSGAFVMGLLRDELCLSASLSAMRFNRYGMGIVCIGRLSY